MSEAVEVGEGESMKRNRVSRTDSAVNGYLCYRLAEI